MLTDKRGSGTRPSSDDRRSPRPPPARAHLQSRAPVPISKAERPCPISKAERPCPSPKPSARAPSPKPSARAHLQSRAPVPISKAERTSVPKRQSGANKGSRPLDVASSREAVKRRQAQAKRAGPRPAGQSTSSWRHQAPCPATPGTDHASEATCKPSSVPPLYAAGTVIHLGRRLPGASSGRPEGEATHSFRDPPKRAPIALLFGLAPGRACPFHPAQPACAGLPVRHCGAGPRLTADGCYPLPCVAELGLSSCRQRVSPTWHATIRSPRWHVRV